MSPDLKHTLLWGGLAAAIVVIGVLAALRSAHELAPLLVAAPVVVVTALAAAFVRDAKRKLSARSAHVTQLEARIAEHERADQEQERAHSQLLHAQKMDAAGSLAGDIAHDFNNILTVINGHASMAMSQLEPGHPPFRDLVEITKAGERAANLTRQLQAFSRNQDCDPVPLDLTRVVAAQESKLRELLDEDIELSIENPTEVGLVEADPDQIQQILLHLVVNARDAVDELSARRGPKTIVIRIASVSLDEAYVAQHPDSREGRHVILSVSDNGCGIQPKDRDRIFDPFYTTKPVGKGRGLGLAMVYGVVHQNHGSVHVYSEPSQGTVVSVYWPESQLAHAEDRGETADLVRSGGHERILFVEDDGGVRRFTTLALEAMGYSVVAACDGAEAMILHEDEEEPFDLLLTDVIMPEMNGQELAERIGRAEPSTRILYCSGYSAEHITRSGLLPEGADFIQKPFDVQSLAAKVRSVLDALPEFVEAL